MYRRLTGKDIVVLIDGYEAPYTGFEYTLSPDDPEKWDIASSVARGTLTTTGGAPSWDVLDALAQNDYVRLDVLFPDEKVEFDGVSTEVHRDFPPDGVVETVIEWEAGKRRVVPRKSDDTKLDHMQMRRPDEELLPESDDKWADVSADEDRDDEEEEADINDEDETKASIALRDLTDAFRRASSPQ